ncbi:MAG: hypothetical protein L3J56_07480 [Bacteroidales bacterium]|nr:hypothetical protein [Bacteroidales bacterium]
MIKTISHIIFSVLFLALTVGISINKHYSNGKLYSQSFFGEAEKCNMNEDGICDMQNMPVTCEIHKQQTDKNEAQSTCSCEDSSEYVHFNAHYTVPEKLAVNNTPEREMPPFYNFLFRNNNNLFLNNYIPKINFGNILSVIPDKTSLFQVFKC